MNTKNSVKWFANVLLLIIVGIFVLLFIRKIRKNENYYLEKKRLEAEPIEEKYCYLMNGDTMNPVMPIRSLKDKDLLFSYYQNNLKPIDVKWNVPTSLALFYSSRIEVLEYIDESLALIRTDNHQQIFYVPIFSLHDTLPEYYIKAY